MNDNELHFFEAVKLFNEELYWDAIETFQNSLAEGLEDRYVDDCFLNIAICYMQLKLFNEAEVFFLKAISSADQSGDQIDFEGPIYGKTSDRAKLGLIRIALVQKNLQKAEEFLTELKNSDSYIEVEGNKILMFEAAQSEIQKAKSSFL
ncbi:hypothetical protein OAK06_07945 [Gammaproteobacteria bacterium]|nr:hypothetical protein [Gammaproteobacteria bacterium]